MDKKLDKTTMEQLNIVFNICNDKSESQILDLYASRGKVFISSLSGMCKLKFVDKLTLDETIERLESLPSFNDFFSKNFE